MNANSPTVGPSRRKRLYWGLAGVGFYGAHAAFYLNQGLPEDLLWSCHLACLFTGLAWLFPSAMLNAVALLWLVVGAPLWVKEILDGGWWIWTSPLTHLGGLVVAIAGLFDFGFPRGAWWRALIGLVLLNVLCRWITPVASNVNLAFAVWHHPESTRAEHLTYLAELAGACAVLFYFAERLLRRQFPTGQPPLHAISS